MEIIVDGDTGFPRPPGQNTLGAALSEIDYQLHEQGRGMTAVLVDGVAIAPGALDDALCRRPMAEVQRLEVRSETVRALVETSLQELDDVLFELPNVCQLLAEVIQGDTPGEGYQKFEQLVEIWAIIKTRQKQAADAMELHLDKLTLDDVSLAKRHGDLDDCLKTAVTALQEDDLATLCDLLAYELAPRAKDETRIVQLLRAELEE